MKEKIKQGELYLVGTPIGNLKDITYRAIETLNTVDVILAEDTRQSLKLLNAYGIKKPLLSYHKFNETEKLKDIEQLLDQGKNLALISDAGMPRVSDPGKILVIDLIDKGYKVNVIPGVTALTTAIVLTNIDTDTFIFEGFLPVRRSRKKARIKSLLNEERSMVFYEAPHKLLQTLKDLKDELGNRNICILRELTKLHEEVIHLSINNAILKIEEEGIKGEIVLIVEGISKEEKEKTELEVNKDKSIKQIVEEYILSGMDKKEAIKKAAKLLNKNKNEVYMECIDEKNK